VPAEGPVGTLAGGFDGALPHAPVVIRALAVFERLPEASKLLTLNVYVVAQSRPVTENDVFVVVPTARPLTLTRYK
jgi:hypothetical protein